MERRPWSDEAHSLGTLDWSASPIRGVYGPPPEYRFFGPGFLRLGGWHMGYTENSSFRYRPDPAAIMTAVWFEADLTRTAAVLQLSSWYHVK